jgi:hypothetical protein
VNSLLNNGRKKQIHKQLLDRKVLAVPIQRERIYHERSTLASLKDLLTKEKRESTRSTLHKLGEGSIGGSSLCHHETSRARISCARRRWRAPPPSLNPWLLSWTAHVSRPAGGALPLLLALFHTFLFSHPGRAAPPSRPPPPASSLKHDVVSAAHGLLSHILHLSGGGVASPPGTLTHPALPPYVSLYCSRPRSTAACEMPSLESSLCHSAAAPEPRVCLCRW